MLFQEIMNHDPSNRVVYEELKTRMEEKIITPFIGSGLSAGYGLPTWTDLLMKMVVIAFKSDDSTLDYDKIIEKYEQNKVVHVLTSDNSEIKDLNTFRESLKTAPEKAITDIIKHMETDINWDFNTYWNGIKDFFNAVPEKAASMISEKMSKNQKNFKEELAKNIPLATRLSDEIKKQSYDKSMSFIPLFFRNTILTTNYDNILRAVYDTADEVSTSEGYNEFRTKEALIYQLHGNAKLPSSMIITTDDYEKGYATEVTGIKKDLKKICEKHYLLFLGCGLKKDRYLDVLKENPDKIHYAIVEASTDDIGKRKQELEEKKIKAIYYPQDKHDSINVILGRLCYDLKIKGSDVEKVLDGLKDKNNFFKNTINRWEANNSGKLFKYFVDVFYDVPELRDYFVDAGEKLLPEFQRQDIQYAHQYSEFLDYLLKVTEQKKDKTSEDEQEIEKINGAILLLRINSVWDIK